MSSYFVVRVVTGDLTWRRLRRLAGRTREAGIASVGVRFSRAFRRPGREVLEQQLELVAVLMAGAMATGQTLVQALEGCSAEVSGEPLGPELRRVIDGYRVGTPILTGLISMAGNLQHPDADYLVRVVEIHLMSGGDLSDALGNVAATIRRRRALRGEIRAGCADARLSAVIIAACPFILGLFTALARPEMFGALIGTRPGRIGLLYGTLSWLAGVYLSNKVSKVEDV